MFFVDSDNSINLTRGDIAVLEVSSTAPDGSDYIFQPGDVVRFRVHVKKKPEEVLLQKDIYIEALTETVDIPLSGEDTKFGELINKPKEYWYEVELNPDDAPQTILGYDTDGAKIFRLYPEGGDLE